MNNKYTDIYIYIDKRHFIIKLIITIIIIITVSFPSKFLSLTVYNFILFPLLHFFLLVLLFLYFFVSFCFHVSFSFCLFHAAAAHG